MGVLKPVSLQKVQVIHSIFRRRKDVNTRYLMELKKESLVQHHKFEAMLPVCGQEEQHHGWEHASSYLKGHFLGHWLSAAARTCATDNNPELKGKLEAVVEDLHLCQQLNGGQWVGPMPEKYFANITQSRVLANPHYIMHKTLMGLWDTYEFTGNTKALKILENAALWFHTYAMGKSEAEMAAVLDVETGGMLEIWANLYGETQKNIYYDLIQKYDRKAFFDRLLAGEDALTNVHCNTTSAEIVGAARVYEVTGEERYRQIVEAFWETAIRKRGYFCTGNPTSGEVFCPPGEFAPRLGISTQEHCSAYNMTRVAEKLFSWTGEAEYADYIERYIYNGALAQQNPYTGTVSYFMPMAPGVRKIWGSKTNDFWCCHGTMVQTQSSYERFIYYTGKNGITIGQYIPSCADMEINGVAVHVEMVQHSDCGEPQTMVTRDYGYFHKPEWDKYQITISPTEANAFAVQLRLPWWLGGQASIEVNGIPVSYETKDGFALLPQVWEPESRITIRLPKELYFEKLPGSENQFALLYGPKVFVGLTDREELLYGDAEHPQSMFHSISERPFGNWEEKYITARQDRSIQFVPVCDVVDEIFTTYFRVQNEREER